MYLQQIRNATIFYIMAEKISGFYRLSAVIRDMSDIHKYSDHSLFSSQPLYTQ